MFVLESYHSEDSNEDEGIKNTLPKYIKKMLWKVSKEFLEKKRQQNSSYA